MLSARKKLSDTGQDICSCDIVEDAVKTGIARQVAIAKSRAEVL
jgi:hypothetical protein